MNSKKLKNIIEVNEIENQDPKLTPEIKPIKKKRKTKKCKTEKKCNIGSEQAYCLKCKKACNVKNKDITTNNNRRRMIGNCETCNTKVHKFLKKE